MESFRLVRPPQSKSMKSSKVVLSPGEEVGEHVTDNREEIIIVLRGRATIVMGNRRFNVAERESHYIGEGVKHNVLNETKEPLEYVYVVSLLGD